MKFSITKEEHDALPEEQKALYTAKGDVFLFTVEGMPDVEGMQKKLNELLDETKASKAKAKADAEAKAKADEDAARARGDIEALDKSYAEKLALAEQKLSENSEKYKKQITKLTVTKEAQSLAAELFGEGAGPLLHNVASRLTLEETTDGEFKVRVMTPDGKVSANSIDDLKREFTENKAFQPFLVTSRATGPTGATERGATSRTTGVKDDGASEEERVKLFRENPAEFNRRYGVRVN